MLMPAADIDSASFSSVVGGRWRREYASNRADGRILFVFRRVDDEQDLLVLRSDDICPGATRLDLPGIGRMYCHRFDRDPGLQGLQEILHTYVSYKVLRYRPGKRITLAAIDQAQGRIIVKCVAAGIDDIFQRQSCLWELRNSLAMCISQPILCLPEWNTFVQRRLPGKPLLLHDLLADSDIAPRMADAVSSLHHSDICFDSYFGTREQQARSVRYGELIKTRLPDLATEVDGLISKLVLLAASISDNIERAVPIHGSLHSHQWLLNGERLALIDFDRAAMGHAELDIATFISELDYEPFEYAQTISQTFLEGFEDVDLPTLAYYRAHKHLAKAFKASKNTCLEVAANKTRRNLARATSLLANIDEVRQ